MPVPIAVLVCEGDLETVAHTAAALKNKLPVIIMKGSGKAADLILDYMERYSKIFKNLQFVTRIHAQDMFEK